jgi:hypothetical protein
MHEQDRIPVERLYVGALHTTPIERDWSEGYADTWESFEAPSCPECDEYCRYDRGRYAWVCPSDPQDCDNGDGEVDPFDGGAEGPMMNYAYPLEDLGVASDEHDAADRIRDLPLCLVSFNEGGHALALTGGGMDLSWEICEAFTRLGFLPPLHFCDLPGMAGYPRNDGQRYVIEACKRSATAAQDQARSILERLEATYPPAWVTS